MERNLFKYIWRHSRAEQVWVLIIVLLSMPFYFLALDIPKSIVNGPIQGQGFESPGATVTFLEISLPVPAFLEKWLGASLDLFSGFDMERISYLTALSLAFLGMVCINGLFKYYINSFKGRMGERMLRRLRYQLVDRVLRFPIMHFRKVRSSEIATMVKDEVEPLGGFIGEAFVSPVFLGGQAATALLFIIIQDPWLGGLAGGIVLFQTFLIPRLRRRLLELGRQRQITSRQLAGRVGEIVDGIAEVHINDTSNYERADFTRRLGDIFWIRYEIYQRKFFIKFLNNFLAQLTPFIFYLLGGYMAIRGTLDIGQLVAVIAAYKDLPSPIKELIDWDQRRLDVQIKYTQVVEQFDPEHMLDSDLQAPLPGPIPKLAGEVSFRNLSLIDETGSKLVERMNASFPVDAHIAVTGSVGDGGSAMSEALVRLLPISSGRISIGGKDVETLAEAVTGRRIAYVGPDTYLAPVSVAENLTYGLRHVPVDKAERSSQEQIERTNRLAEARLAGNLELDPEADWIDYESAGATGPDDLGERILETLERVGLAEDIFEFGLKGTIDPAQNPDFAAAIVKARRALHSRLDTKPLSELVDPFDPERYNPHATLGENLLFGTPVDDTFAADNLPTNAHSLEVLEATGLRARLLEMGHSIAGTVVELFSGLPPDHPFFDQVSFMSADDLPEYEAILKRVAGSPLDQASDTDKSRLMVLPFSYIEPRHRLGLLDQELMDLVLKGRGMFRASLPKALEHAVEFYDPDLYNAASSLQDNILLGRVAYGIAMANEQVRETIQEVLAEIGLRSLVYRVGLEFNVGTGGKRLNVIQRQKIGLARALLKRPDLIVVNRALAAMDDENQRTIIDDVRKSTRQGSDRIGLIWVLANSEMARGFDQVFAFKDAVMVSKGTPAEILGPGPSDTPDDPVPITV